MTEVDELYHIGKCLTRVTAKWFRFSRLLLYHIGKCLTRVTRATHHF